MSNIVSPLDQLAAVEQVWRDDRCLSETSIYIYRLWVQRFLAYCQERSINNADALTLEGAAKFSYWYAKSRNIALSPVFKSSRSALYSWAHALKAQEIAVPNWTQNKPSEKLRSTIQREFSDYLQLHRGSPSNTIHKKVKQVDAFMRFLREKGKHLRRIKLKDIDDYTAQCSKRYARATVSDICSTLRRFCHFLFSTQRLSVDFASSIATPKYVVEERPYRALPWNDICRILRSIERTSAGGYRDYALLLMMSVYGLGAGEVIGLTLDSINWAAGTFQVTRPKTGFTFELPLLPSAVKALVNYLRHGRPPHATTRHLFVTLKVPHKSLACSTTIRHILHKHAQNAGVRAEYLGTHVLRYTHACQQMELETTPKVISDILGHRNPKSTSAYLRVSIEHLRDLALAVPS